MHFASRGLREKIDTNVRFYWFGGNIFAGPVLV